MERKTVPLSLPAHPRQNHVAVKMLLKATSALVLGTVGCAGTNEQTDTSPSPRTSVVKAQPKQAASPPPLTEGEAFIESAMLHEVALTALEIFQKSTRMAEIDKELAAIEEPCETNQRTLLYQEKAKCQVDREIAAFKAFKKVMEAPPRTWPRLLNALRDISQGKVAVPDVTALQAKQFGPLTMRSNDDQVRMYQALMYKEQAQLLATLVAEIDKGIGVIFRKMQLTEDDRERRQLEAHRGLMESKRQRLLDFLEKGGLFPAYPQPSKAVQQQILDAFIKTREGKGGLPAGNSSQPTGIHFGPIQEPVKHPVPEPPSPPRDPKPTRPVKEQPKPKPGSNRPRVAQAEVPAGLEAQVALLTIFLHSQRPGLRTS